MIGRIITPVTGPYVSYHADLTQTGSFVRIKDHFPELVIKRSSVIFFKLWSSNDETVSIYCRPGPQALDFGLCEDNLFLIRHV